MQRAKSTTHRPSGSAVVYTANNPVQENDTVISSPTPSVITYSKSEIEIKNLYKKLPAYQTIEVKPASHHHLATTGDVDRPPDEPPRYDTLYPD